MAKLTKSLYVSFEVCSQCNALVANLNFHEIWHKTIQKTKNAIKIEKENSDNIENFQFSERLYKILTRVGVKKIWQLTEISPDEICDISGIGPTSFHEIINVIDACDPEYRKKYNEKLNKMFDGRFSIQ